MHYPIYMKKQVLFFSTTLIGILFVLLLGTTLPVYSQVFSDKSTIIVDESGQKSLSQELVGRVQNSWPWYVTRASGIVAAIAMTLLMLSGIGFITGSTYTFLEPLIAWATHRSLGIVLTISLLAHMIALYFDHFVPFSISDLLIPFASNYKEIEVLGHSIGSLYVALGVISFYLIIIIVLMSLVWIEKKASLWKATHLTSYLAMAFVFFHALFLGTDLANGIGRFIWIAIGVIILVATLIRFWRVKTV